MAGLFSKSHVAHLHLVRNAAEGDDGPVLKFKRRDDAQFLDRPRQVADDEAAPAFQRGSLSGRVQTSRRRLAMTHRNERNIVCVGGSFAPEHLFVSLPLIKKVQKSKRTKTKTPAHNEPQCRRWRRPGRSRSERRSARRWRSRPNCRRAEHARPLFPGRLDSLS